MTKPTKPGPDRSASEPATSGDLARRRGRPATRSRTSLLWTVWRLVRREVAYNGAASALQACTTLLERHHVIRVTGLVSTAIVDPATLHQWYRAAERARTTDPELSAYCAAWERQTAEHWREHVGLVAASESLMESDRAGLTRTGRILEVSAKANEAATIAQANAGQAPAPRKNRRR